MPTYLKFTNNYIYPKESLKLKHKNGSTIWQQVERKAFYNINSYQETHCLELYFEMILEVACEHRAKSDISYYSLLFLQHPNCDQKP